VAKHQSGEEFLKPEQHYIDLYDLFTINECLDAADVHRKAYKTSLKAKKFKDTSKKEKERSFGLLLHRHLYAVKGERYKNKANKLKEWVDRDQGFQDKYDNTPEPQYFCPKCNEQLKGTLKSLENQYNDKPLRVSFIFRCNPCKKGKIVYDNGEIKVSKPFLCPECNKEAIYTHEKKGKTITWITKCKSCGFKKVDKNDYEKKRAQWAKEEQRDKDLLKKYRNECCLTDKQGKQYIETMEALEYSKFAFEDEKRKYDNPVYEKVSKIKQVGISELETMLSKALKKAEYTKFELGTPDMGHFIVVSFSMRDSDPNRNKKTALYDLKKLIKDTLEETNWKLTSQGVSERLGFITGKLKGYEREKDLLELAGKIKEDPNPITDIDKRQKLEANNFVQVARICGKQEAIENIRNRGLEKYPDGYLLNEPDKYHSCQICGETIQNSKAWWDKWGMKCLDCKRNVDEGVIPPEVAKDKDSWLEDWSFKSSYGVHPATRGKLVRQGILKVRELKREDGGKYFNVYLIDDNKEFFKKYPKIPSKMPKVTFSSSKE
jgi:hypothetical protein